CSATQSCSRARMPDSPASRALHDSGAVPPRGELAPMPVTTIFLVMGTLLVLGQRYEGNSVRDAGRPGRAFARPGLPCITAKGLGLRLDDEVDGVANGLEVLDLFVGDLDVELLFSVDDDRHHRDGVDVEVVREGLVEL